VAVGAFGRIITSNDFGKTWSPVAVNWADFVKDGYEPHLYDVRIAFDGSIIVAGEFGTLIRSRDRAATWQQLRSGGASLFSIAFLPSGLGIAVGQNGLVVRSTDGGNTWSDVGVPTTGNLVGVWASSSSEVIAVGMRTLIRSSDGGRSWRSSFGPDVVRGWYESVQGAAGGGIFLVGHDGGIAKLR